MKRILLAIAVVCLGATASWAQTASGTLTAASSACTAVDSCVVLTLDRTIAAVTVQLSGTFSATATFEGSLGQRWDSILCTSLAAGTQATTATNASTWTCPAAGLLLMRVRPSAYTSGTMAVDIRSSSGSAIPVSGTFSGSISGNAAAGTLGAAAPSSGNYTAGKDPSGNLAGVSTVSVSSSVGLASYIIGGVTLSANIGNITGTVSLPTGAASASNQTNGAQVAQARLYDSAGNAVTVDALGSKRVIATELVDGSGNQITSFGISGGSVVATFNTANLATNITQIGGASIATAASGIAKVGITDASGNSITTSLLGSTRAIPILIVDGSGNQITNFGGTGGTSSSVGSTFPSTATAAGFKNASGNMVGATVTTVATSANLDTYVNNLVADAADNATATSNPVPIGCVYQSSPTALTNGQGAYVLCNTGKRLLTGAGFTAFAATQTSVANTATQLVAANTSRGGVTCTQLGTVDVYLGASGVTTSTGYLLVGVKGAAVSIPTTAALYGIVATGTQTVACVEVY